jgi:hypothetical protein
MIPDAPRDQVPVLVDEPWATRYEEMRRQVMTQFGSIDHAYGYVLLVRRGLVAWMKAWPRPASQPSRDPRSGQPVDAATIPSPLLQSATSLLVNMILILAAQTEVPHEQRSREGLPQPS